jgi:hypothetical protein
VDELQAFFVERTLRPFSTISCGSGFTKTSSTKERKSCLTSLTDSMPGWNKRVST